MLSRQASQRRYSWQYLRIARFLIVFILVNVVLSSGVVGTQLVILRNMATVKTVGIGVYWDAECTSPVSDISWGKIEPNETKVISVYVRNEGNADVTLSVEAADWDPPEAISYVKFNCSYQGQVIKTDSSIRVELILFLLPDVQGVTHFSFQVALEASG